MWGQENPAENYHAPRQFTEKHSFALLGNVLCALIMSDLKFKYKIINATEKIKNDRRFLNRPKPIHTC